MLRNGKEMPIILWPDDVPRYPRTQNINIALGHSDTMSSGPHLGSSSEDQSVTKLKFYRYKKAPQTTPLNKYNRKGGHMTTCKMPLSHDLYTLLIYHIFFTSQQIFIQIDDVMTGLGLRRTKAF